MSPWFPTSEEERELVREELDAIVSSHHFRGSKRYPAMLKYVVFAAIDGRASDLKERTLGVEVFGRDPDYDTNADPVVRISAGEVRKRIAQFYHENGHGAKLEIELPLGSYAPEFLLREPEGLKAQTGHNSQKPVSTEGHPDKRSRRYLIAALAAIVILSVAAALGIYAYHKAASLKSASIDELWRPMIKSPDPVLVVVGTGHNADQMSPELAETTFFDRMTGPYHHVSVATATTLANVAAVLRQRGTAFEIKEDNETSLTDMHLRTIILIGATNNAWTMRLVGPLRFRFLPGPKAQVQDTKNLQNTDWSVDFLKPYASISTDYAIVARYRDPTTEGPVMVVAGLGPFGTEAGGAFVSTPQYLEQLAKQLPQGWENKNIELVLKTEVIDGKAGPPVLISATEW
ncbi:MAG: hypothetical protein ACLPT4_15090 [Verrucomicrobiia bacterium]